MKVRPEPKEMVIVSPQGDEITVRFLEVGPEHAEARLGANTHNRSLSDKTADSYGRSMGAGDWIFTGDPLQIANTGEVLNGQHRYEAIGRSGAPQWMIEILGLPLSVQPYVDIGRRRSAADQLRIDGVPYPGQVAGVARTLLLWQAWLPPHRNGNFNPSNNEVIAYAHEHHGLMQRACDHARDACRKVGGGVSLAAVAAAYVRAEQRIGDVFAVSDFFTKLASGADVQEGDAILTLRNSMIRSKKNGLIFDLTRMVRCLNAHFMGEPLGRYNAPPGRPSALKVPDVVTPYEVEHAGMESDQELGE